jgi:outer membrane protein assembly factor BamB
MDPLTADDPRVIGEFRLHARLGAGGMGRVFLGSSPGGRAVAVKIIHPHLASNGAFAGRFRREVAAALAVNGGYAAPVIAAGPDDSPPWLATAFVPGPSLQYVVATWGPLPEEAVLKLAAGLAEALRSIHACGLVHRDLKPGNVLLAADGPRVIDFGIARALDGTILTSAESVLGTPSYMSPEQAQGRPADPASDVFSLGCLLFFAAAGRSPFGDGTPAALLYRIVHSQPDLSGLPPRLCELLEACLAKDPFVRPLPEQLAAALMPAAPPGTSPAAFRPAPVARVIGEYAARLSAGSVTAPGSRSPVTQGPAVQAPPLRPTAPEPDPGIVRRRALATLAGMVTAGLAVTGWELTRDREAGQPTSNGRAAAGPPAPGAPGTKVWSVPANSSVAAVTVAGRVVYAGTNEATLYALDAATGRPHWRRATLGTNNYQLAVAPGRVIIGSDLGVHALDAATGQRVWNVPPGPIGMCVAGDVVYAGMTTKSDTTGGVTALSTGTGEVLWSIAFGPVSDIAGGVAVAGGVVYASTAAGEIYALDAATGRRIWRIAGRNVSFSPPGPVVADAIVYAPSNAGTIYAVHAATGRPRWQQNIPGSQYLYLTVADGLVFAASASRDSGNLIAFNASTGQRLWTAPVPGGPDLGPVPAGNVVYTGSNTGVLDAWQATTGNKLWSYRAGDSIGTKVVVAGGRAYFGSNDHNVYAVAT